MITHNPDILNSIAYSAFTILFLSGLIRMLLDGKKFLIIEYKGDVYFLIGYLIMVLAQLSMFLVLAYFAFKEISKFFS